MNKKLTRKDASRIIQALRKGTPPTARLVPYMNVGRERWLEGMKWYLDKCHKEGLSAVRFLIGDYGDGKTHFARMTAYMALKCRFITCEVTLSREVRLDRFNTIWREMMGKLMSPDADGDEPEGIEGILNRWCSQTTPEHLADTLRKLDSIPNLDPDFLRAMRGYLQAWWQDGDTTAYLQWLKGDPIRPPGVRAHIDRTSARAMLRSLVLFLKYLGYSGLVLFLDELELIRDQKPSVRDSAYDVLRQFIDDADNIPSFLLICSLTPAMCTDDNRGILSYPALAQRVQCEGNLKDYRAITVRLDSIPLTDDELFALTKRLRHIHAIAIGWRVEQKIGDATLKKLVERAKRQAGAETSLPRFIVEAVVELLEMVNQNPDMDAEEALEQILVKADEIIHEKERERHRPWEGG